MDQRGDLIFPLKVCEIVRYKWCPSSLLCGRILCKILQIKTNLYVLVTQRNVFLWNWWVD